MKQALKRTKQLDELFEAILMLKDEEECYKFFADICTENEINAMAQRLEVAKLLKIRKTYHEIEEETGASTATISRVNRSLGDGYALVLDHLIRKNLEEQRRRRAEES